METQPEDMTLEQIKEQLALYSRCYCQKKEKIRTLWIRKDQMQYDIAEEKINE